jgi:putative oxidoreductase
MAVGLLLIRIVVGGTVALHGVQKLTTKMQGHGFAGAKEMATNLGLRPVVPYALAAAFSELFGGLFVALGFVTPFGAMAVVGMMLTAVLVVHLRNGYFVVHGGFEYPFVLGTCTAAIAVLGPGRYSIDHALGWSLYGWKWFAVAVGGGAFVSLLTFVNHLLHKKPAPEAA